MGIPPTHVLNFTGGDAVKFAFQIKDKDLDFPEDPPVPRDLTGWTALSQIRKTPASPAVLTSWEIEELDSTGIVRMKLTGAQTQPLILEQQVVSDIQLTNPDGDPETVLKLTLNVAQDITRDE